MTRRQRAELVQSEGFGEAKATHHRDEKVTVSGQGASLKSITNFFCNKGKSLLLRAHLRFYCEFSEVYLWKRGQCDVHINRVWVVTTKYIYSVVQHRFKKLIL